MTDEQGKLPSMQWYPADWRKDPGVQALSFHDRGVWFEIIMLMHESTERGVLLLNGKPMPDEALARLLGLDNQILTTTLTTLLTYGVTSRRESDGALVCRRMLRDEHLRKVRKEVGKLGGNPRLVNQKSNQIPTTRVNQKSTPSSSSSSSSSPPPEGSSVSEPHAGRQEEELTKLFQKFDVNATIRTEFLKNGGSYADAIGILRVVTETPKVTSRKGLFAAKLRDWRKA